MAQQNVVYNGRNFEFPGDKTLPEMKAAMAVMYPELANGSYRTLENGTIEFYVVAQNKSAVRNALYNGRNFEFPADKTIAEMKAAMAVMYPELANGSYRELTGGTIEFYVVAQNKSADVRNALYNGRNFEFPADKTIPEMKAAMAVMYPELANGSYRELTGGTIEFYVVAQNKSAVRNALYNGRNFEFPADKTIAEMKAAMAVMYPELANGSYRELTGGTIEFYVVAQNKSN